jgi:uncharacterized membrane protein YeiH
VLLRPPGARAHPAQRAGFDAVGLGLFSVTGDEGLDFGVGPVQAVLLGAITGVGGGMLRDVLLREIPTVLRHDLHAIPALLGSAVMVVAQKAGFTSPVFPVLGAAVGVPLVGLRYGVNVPIAPSERERGDRPPP